MAQTKRTPHQTRKPAYWDGWTPAQIAAEIITLRDKADAAGRIGDYLTESINLELIAEMRRDLEEAA